MIIRNISLLIGLLLSTNAIAAETVLSSHSGSASSAFSGLSSQNYKSDVLSLTDGTYTLKLLSTLVNSGASSYASAGAALYKYTLSGAFVGGVMSLSGENNSVGTKTLDLSTTFNLTDTANYLFAFTSIASAAGGSSSLNATLSQVTAVPGPEAGAGLGALAMGGMALYLKRRRKEDAAA